MKRRGFLGALLGIGVSPIAAALPLIPATELISAIELTEGGYLISFEFINDNFFFDRNTVMNEIARLHAEDIERVMFFGTKK